MSLLLLDVTESKCTVFLQTPCLFSVRLIRNFTITLQINLVPSLHKLSQLRFYIDTYRLSHIDCTSTLQVKGRDHCSEIFGCYVCYGGVQV